MLQKPKCVGTWQPAGFIIKTFYSPNTKPLKVLKYPQPLPFSRAWVNPNPKPTAAGACGCTGFLVRLCIVLCISQGHSLVTPPASPQ